MPVASTVTPTTGWLSLKPNGSPRGVPMGARRPRSPDPGSTDPAIELAALIEAVGARRAPVRRIALNMPGRDSAARRIRLDRGRRVAVDWFRTSGVHLVRIVHTNDQRIALLIIPVDSRQAIAHLALTTTDAQDHIRTPVSSLT
ncbi:MAG: DUF5994 family protein [Pseudonocardiaceae bacterium]